MNVTLKDIAKAVGISVNSVSKALKDSPNISKETKRRVNETAQALGYIPNMQALNLRKSKTNLIAIVYDNLVNPYYSIMNNLLIERLGECGYDSMIMIDHYSDGFLSETLVKKLISYNVCGIITFISPMQQAASLIKDYQVPCIVLGRNAELTNTSSVYSDDYYGGKIAARELIKLGGKNFVYVTAHSALKISELRLNGFKNELARNNIALKKDHILIGDHEKNTKLLIHELIESDNTIDSIFCFSDLNATEIISEIQDKHPYMLKKLNIIGFDNLKKELDYLPHLSSIDGGKIESIDIAIDYINDLVRNGYKEEPIYKKVKPFYDEGQSTKNLK